MRILATAACLMLIASAAQAQRKPVPAATVIGPEVSCVHMPSIRQTMVRDDQTIDFVMRDGRWFRNTLPNRCPQLGFERAFAYQNSITQLCNVDIITVIVQGAGSRRGASCGLGKFTPIEPITSAKK